MMLQGGRIGWLLIALAAIGPKTDRPSAEASLDKLIDEILRVAEKHTSVSAKTTILIDTQTALAKVHSKGEGTYQSLVKGKRVMFRMQVKSLSTYKSGDQEQQAMQTVTQVGDGDHIYQLSEQAGRRPAVLKQVSDPGKTNVVCKAFFDSLRRDFALQEQPDEKVDGQDAWTLQATPRNAERSHTARILYHIRKDGGVLIKTTRYDSADNVLDMTTLSDVKLDAWISPDRFVFEAPPGVQVIDLTQSSAPTTSMRTP